MSRFVNRGALLTRSEMVHYIVRDSDESTMSEGLSDVSSDSDSSKCL